MRIGIKPLSANDAWKGRRFKSQEYKSYEARILSVLHGNRCYLSVTTEKLKLTVSVGVSSKNADLDNTIKQLQDIVTKFFKINDKRIYKIEAEKFDVKKGQEFIDFDIVDYEQTSCTPL